MCRICSCTLSSAAMAVTQFFPESARRGLVRLAPLNVVLSLLDWLLAALIEVGHDEQDRAEHNEGDDPVSPVER